MEYLITAIVTVVAMSLAFYLGKMSSLITIIRQIPKNIDFEIDMTWFGRTKIKFIDKDNETNG